VPAFLSVNFDLVRRLYFPPPDNKLDFSLLKEGELPIVYPVPPTHMVSDNVKIVIASNISVNSSSIEYSLTPEHLDIKRALRAGDLAARDRLVLVGWGEPIMVDERAGWSRTRWGAVAAKDLVAVSQAWNMTPRKDDPRGGAPQGWDKSIKLKDDSFFIDWNTPAIKDVIKSSAHSDSSKYWVRPRAIRFDGYIATTNFDLGYRQYFVPNYSAVGFNLLPTAELNDFYTPTHPVDSNRKIQGWGASTQVDKRFRHPWDRKPRIGTELEWDYDQEPPLPDKDPADIPEIKEAYLYMNASSLKKMPEGIPLEFADLQISLDIDSFSWAMSATILNQASMNQIKPGPSGPVEVEAKVNNKTWRFMIERYSMTSKHPKTTYKVTGSSLTQLLAAPYSAKQSAQIETPTNALQVIQNLLEFTGFEIDWDVSLADYTIPAGAWGYESKTPIEVIDELVKAAGGVLVPATALSKLYAAQRYREAPPWYWPEISAGSLDFQIADSTVLSMSSEWQPTTEYRGVYVSGITQGVAVDVKKTGTDGLPRAPDVYDVLNLTTQQCRGRGISILGQSGAQEIVTIELPLPTSGAPGLVVPGKWGEIQDTNDSENNWRALVLSTTVSVSRPGASRATQTIRLERHHY